MSYKVTYYDEIPFSKDEKFTGKNQILIKEFLQSLKPYALIEDQGRNSRYVANSLYQSISRLHIRDQVRAKMVNGKVYLVRIYKGDGIHDED